jgi:hypothetical protein
LNDDSDPLLSQRDDWKDLKGSLDSNPESPVQRIQRTESWTIRDKLSREFKINDENELGKLMGDDGEKLLALVDDIRKIESLRNIKLDIPQVLTKSMMLLHDC